VVGCAPNPLHTFPRNFPIETEKLLTCGQLVGKRHDATNTTEFALDNLLRTCCALVVYVADLLRGSRQLVMDLLRANWCNRFWPLRND